MPTMVAVNSSEHDRYHRAEALERSDRAKEPHHGEHGGKVYPSFEESKRKMLGELADDYKEYCRNNTDVTRARTCIFIRNWKGVK